ncbi:MAG: acetyl-CoA carboxylase carboxyl transferase subunit beta, partial [Oscillochloris sp.]|nr:acetyl-CoA carboxylase carboxyl transferase subunit beta [Oscillochloris sp.]
MKEFFRRRKTSFTTGEQPDGNPVPDDMWVKCAACRDLVYKKELSDSLKVCPKCGHHMRMSACEWLGLLDADSFSETDAGLQPTDPLGFVSLDESYAQKLVKSQQRTGMRDAVISGMGMIGGGRLALAVADFAFMGASMGSVYGEKMSRAAERAADLGMPLLTINSSGGARQQ